MPVSTLERFRRDAETMKHEASRFGFGASLACADRIADLLEKGAEPEDQAFHGEPIIKIQIFHMDAIVREVEHLESRLLDELTNFKVVAVPARKSELLSGKEKFWGLAYQQFPSLIYDLDESIHCYVLERNTAAAIHAIRALEGGINALSLCLGIADPARVANRNWHLALKSIGDEINRRWPTNADRRSGDGHLFEQIHASLSAMKNPYRNASMHLDQRYTAAEAKHVMDLTASLLNRIGERCDEHGQPTA